VPFDGQEKKRRYEEFRDKHGRIYGANVGIKTGDPCETLRAVGWTAPQNPEWYKRKLMPPMDDMEIVQMVPAKLRARKGYQVEIHYAVWLRKWDDAYEALQRKLHDFAKGMTKSSGNMLELVNNPPPELLKLVGRGPLNVPRVFIEAMAAGNPWALGLSDKVPAKAEALLDELKPVVTGQRKGLIIGYDPLADEDDQPIMDETMDRIIDPFGDEEETHDPDAVGGKTIQPGMTPGEARAAKMRAAKEAKRLAESAA
jgi:hypothetical protein